jgi:hypothetical protein
MHIALRLLGPEIRLFENGLDTAYDFAAAAGARSRF